MEEQVKFYKANVIYVMTILFGPCAGGWMMGVNFFHMGKKRAGWLSIILSGVLMAAVMLVMLFMPEHVVDTVPKFVIPVIFGGIAYLIVNKTQREVLQEAAEKEAGFYSNWKSLGTGLLGGLAAVAIVFAIVGIQMMSQQKQWDEMTRYEDEAFKLYDMIEQEVEDEELAKFIEDTGLDCWDKFSGVVEEMGEAPGVTAEELVHINLLKKYATLRKLEFQCILEMTRDKLDREEDLTRVREEIGQVAEEIAAL